MILLATLSGRSAWRNCADGGAIISPPTTIRPTCARICAASSALGRQSDERYGIDRRQMGRHPGCMQLPENSCEQKRAEWRSELCGVSRKEVCWRPPRPESSVIYGPIGGNLRISSKTPQVFGIIEVRTHPHYSATRGLSSECCTVQKKRDAPQEESFPGRSTAN